MFNHYIYIQQQQQKKLNLQKKKTTTTQKAKPPKSLQHKKELRRGIEAYLQIC
jgi:hypothetical protein